MRSFCPEVSVLLFPSPTPVLLPDLAEALLSPRSPLMLLLRMLAGPWWPPSPQQLSLFNPFHAFFTLCKIWTPDANTRRIPRLNVCHTLSICLFRASLCFLVLLFFFCLHLLLPLPTASHRQQLQCIQNKSFQPTFQCL